MPRVMFAGGGTGGHLLPGVSLAEEMCSRFQAQIHFLITARQVDKIVLSSHKFSVTQIKQEPLPKKITRIPFFALRTAQAALRTLREIVTFRPHLIVGLGGFGSFIAVLCGKLFCTPAVLLEQNAFPGKVNRLLSFVADAIFCQWKSTVAFFPFPRKVFPLGNPIRGSLALTDKKAARISLGLSPETPTLLVLGGSQGAHAINAAMCKTAATLNGEKEKVQIIHLAGARDKSEVEEVYRKNNVKACVIDFLQEMEKAYSAADLVFCRAGGTTIAELTALGLPSILVPFPQAAENHQMANALELKRTCAAIVLPQNEITPLNVTKYVLGLLTDRERLAQLAKNAKSLGSPDAAGRIARKIDSHFSLSAKRYSVSPLL